MPIVSIKSQSERAVGAGRGRTSVTGRWDELLKQMARIPCTDCFKSQSERAVGASRGRMSVTGRWDELKLFHFNQISVSQSLFSN